MERNINIRINDSDEIEIIDDFIEDWVYTVKVINKWHIVRVNNSKILFKSDVINNVLEKIKEYNINNIVIILSEEEIFKRSLMKYGNGDNTNSSLKINDVSDRVNILINNMNEYKKEIEAMHKEIETLKKTKDKILTELYEIKANF
jgi:hypothetical protein